MNEKYLYSVIIPAFNREKEIERAIRSVKAQTYRPVEIIIVDNNSSDSTLNVCFKLKEELEEEAMKISISSEKKKGANAARNKGIQLSKGEYITFLDSDDEMLPDKIEQINYAVQSKKPDLIVTNVILEQNKKQNIRMSLNPGNISYQITRSFLCTSNMTFHHEFIKQIGGWDESLMRWQDWEIGIRALLNTESVAFIDKPLHINHIHENSITGDRYAHPDNILLTSIKKAIASTSESKNRQKRTLIRLLYFRIYLLAGLYKREKEYSLSNETLSYARLATRNENLIHRFKLELLYQYTRFHGKGAWYIAMLFFKDLK